jgi:hypothetical protein
VINMIETTFIPFFFMLALWWVSVICADFCILKSN